MKAPSKETRREPSTPANLVSRWRELKKTNEGQNLARALEELNAALDRKYKHHHITRMEKGERQPDVLLHNHLLRYVLAVELSALGITDDNGRTVFERVRLTQPFRDTVSR